jgi:hypothetical protein
MRLLSGAAVAIAVAGASALVPLEAALAAPAATVSKQVVRHPDGQRTVTKTKVKPSGAVRTKSRTKWSKGRPAQVVQPAPAVQPAPVVVRH